MAFISNIFNRNKTFKPIKKTKNLKRDKLSEYAKATLGSGDMKNVVELPSGDLNEWLAVNTVDFFNEISLLYGTVSEHCTKDSCPIMNAGKECTYLWADGRKYKKPIKVSAPEYIKLLMDWVEELLKNEDIFPLQLGVAFPKQFQSVVKQIFKRLFRIYAHIYHIHFESIVEMHAAAHLNTCFKHFIYFVHEFKLIGQQELEPLMDLIDTLMGKDIQEGEGDEDGNQGSDAVVKKKRKHKSIGKNSLSKKKNY